MEPSTVEVLAREALRGNRVVGVLGSDVAPWTRPPSGRPRMASIPGPFPERVRAVLSQRLFVEKAGLPSLLIDQMKRLAAFENPEFHKRQRMRLSTALTPRVIACAQDLDLHLSLPRGCLESLRMLLADIRVELLLDDQRQAGDSVQEWVFRGELTAVQKHAAEAVVAHHTGVFVAPPGVGKTVLGTYVVAARRRPTLVLVHRRPLLDQWVAQLSMFLGIDPKEVGRIGGGRKVPNGRLDVAMIQSLVRLGRVSDVVAGYGLVIVDECHHVPAVSFERVLSEVKARFVLGLTATPRRRDGHHPILEMQLGPVRYSVEARSEAGKPPFDQRLFVRETRFQADGWSDQAGIQALYGALAADSERSDLILDDVIQAVDKGRSPILLTERRTQLEYFADRLRKAVRHVVVLRGGMTPKERAQVMAQVKAIPDSEERVLLATGRYNGEGYDDARLDTLFLAMPVSWKGTLVQYAGRLHRLLPGKNEVQIFDYVDREVPLLARMFQKRLRAYRAIGYVRDETPQPAPSEVTRAYDEPGPR